MRSGICFFIFILPDFISAQNLVPNGGFEAFQRCPGDYTQAHYEFQVDGWRSATIGTPDYFNACSEGEGDVPHNWAGVSEAQEGKGYVGIYLWMNDENNYREYLQCTLTEPLIKDSVYSVAFHYKLSSYSRYSIDRIGLSLSSQAPKSSGDDVLPELPVLSVIQDSALTRNTGLWEKAEMQYKAKGNERFVTIGNFFDNADTRSYEIQFRPVSQTMLESAAYYYIDNVQVIPRYKLKEREALLPQFTLTQVRLNTNYALRNLQFEFNSYRLVPPSFDELSEVARYLGQNPSVKVQLFGHTDDQGSDNYNLRLSQNRAKAAAAYIASLGVNAQRIEVFGYGETMPLVQATTEEARATNRRVEIRFVR